MKKIISKALIYFAAAVAILFAIELSIYIYNSAHFYKNSPEGFKKPGFGYSTEYNIGINFDTYFSGKNNVNEGRLPVGEEYKTKPIVIFGGSYAHGQFLKPEQTLGYKLSELLHRPVYNKGLTGRSFQHTQMLLKNKNFLNTTPLDADCIFVYSPGMFYYMYFNFTDMLDRHFNGTHIIRNGYFIPNATKNPFVLFFKSTYIAKLANRLYYTHFVNNYNNDDKVTDMALMYLTDVRKTIEKKVGHKVNFTVFIYDLVYNEIDEVFADKLQKNGFNVIMASDLTNEDLSSPEYISSENNHPTEAAWNLLAPDLAKGLK